MSLRRAAELCLQNQVLKSCNAFIPRIRDEQYMLRLASEADSRTASGQSKSPLDGRLIAIKDNICTKVLTTTCGSRFLENYTSPFDATVVQSLQDAGAIIAGKTNMDEFGMGSHSTNSYFGAVRNELRHGSRGMATSVGGSSGGSAMAVLAGQCHAALGTDTGGSVRLPAAYTGIVGFKPSYGLVSRWGVVAYANSLDTVGVLATNTETAKSVFDNINHYDPQDPTSLSPSTRSRINKKSSTSIRKNNHPTLLRIGIPSEYNLSELDPLIRRAWLHTIQRFSTHGHAIHPINLPTTPHALSAYYILAPSEASSNLARYDGVRYGAREDGPDNASPDGVLYAGTRGKNFGAEVQRRILLGTYSLSAEAIDNYFVQAQRIRRLVQRDFDAVFDMHNPLLEEKEKEKERRVKEKDNVVDVILCPTAPGLPPLLREVEKLDPLQAYVNDVFTVPASLAGLPAVSVPVSVPGEEGVDGVKQTVGMQIIGQFGDDERVLEAAGMVERWNAAAKLV
ncbi:MAG: Trimeric GatFAB AmidoTransferase(AdT) complex subunit [Peltula sp. TS41687]|nr:MAG: Trimeric GatFAB AmidoTransferase(AdT) complex subunit [Peltula sp. TS41687]